MPSDRPEPDVESSIWISRSPEDIWNYIAEVSTDSQWRYGVIDAQWISDPPHGVGSTGLHIMEGIIEWPWIITALDEPRIMAWVGTGGRFEGSHGAYRIEPEGDGSRFTLEARMKRSVIMRLLILILKGRIKRQNGIALEKLKTILEA